MKVAELKQVVDANAVEMREGFAKVDGEIADLRHEMNERFAKVDERFTFVDVRFDQVDSRFDRLERRIAEQGAEQNHRLGVVLEGFADRIAMIVERALEEKIDLKIAKLEVRLERKFDRKQRR